MKRVHRLRSSRDFKRVIHEGASVARPELVLYHLDRDVREPPRIGLAVTRRIGGAVVRNRVKRLLREAVRPLIPRFAPGVDMVVVARGAAAEADLVELRRAFTEAATRAGLTTPQTTEGHTST